MKNFQLSMKVHVFKNVFQRNRTPWKGGALIARDIFCCNFSQFFSRILPICTTRNASVRLEPFCAVRWKTRGIVDVLFFILCTTYFDLCSETRECICFF